MESSSSTYTYSRRPTEVALRTDSTFIMTNTNDPCWFLGNVPFPTGTEVVAFFGIVRKVISFNESRNEVSSLIVLIVHASCYRICSS